MPKTAIRQFYKASFGGKFPEIEIPADVDMEELTRGDNDPMFITLPISFNNAVADDGLRYSPQLNSAIQQFINANHVTGNKGHLAIEDRETVFDMPAVMWLNSIFDETGTLWAKGYVLPNPEIRQFIRASKATKRGIATSIYGSSDPTKINFNSDGTYDIDVSTFELESLDLAPIERAALKIDRPVQVTAHMKSNEVTDMTLTPEMLAQLTPAQVPATIRDAIIAQFKKDNEGEAAITQLKADNATLVQMNNEMKGIISQMQAKLFDNDFAAEIDAAVNVDAPVLKFAVKNAVLVQMAGNRDIAKAKELLAQFVETDEYKTMAETFVKQMSGGNVIVSSNSISAKTLGEQMEAKLSELNQTYGVRS